MKLIADHKAIVEYKDRKIILPYSQANVFECMVELSDKGKDVTVSSLKTYMGGGTTSSIKLAILNLIDKKLITGKNDKYWVL
jgi:hypothetical protein